MIIEGLESYVLELMSEHSAPIEIVDNCSIGGCWTRLD